MESSCQVSENPEWEKDERYLNIDFREQHGDEIHQGVSTWMIEHTKEEVYHQGQALGCPIAPVMTSEDTDGAW